MRRASRAPRSAHEQVFARIASNREWGGDESVSGPGSGLARTAELRRELPALLAELRVETLMDAGCGDFHWMSAAHLPVRRYIGVDVVPELLVRVAERHSRPGHEFVRADVTRDALPRADLVLCRDVLVHFPDADVAATLENLRRSGSRWLLATTFTERTANEPIELGGWRTLNLQAAPFSLPAPERALPDVPIVDRELYLDKRLGLWDLTALAARSDRRRPWRRPGFGIRRGD